MQVIRIVYISLLFMFFIPLYGFTQSMVTLNGTVKDKATGENLIGAAIKILSPLPKVALTNAYGYYSLNLNPGKYKVEVTYFGYQNWEQEIDITGNLKLDIELAESLLLSEVVITTQKKNDNILNPQMGIQKLSIKDLDNVPVLFGEKDVLKTIQLLPGIKSAGEGSSGFYVRGGAADQNLILLDEAPVYNASHLLGFFSTFNSDAIKDVTLYKGGMPAQYGGRLASVLDIRMNDGNKKQTTVEGGIGLIASRIKLESPLKKDKSSFMISARRTYADAFLAFSPDTAVRGSTLYFYDLNTKLNFQVNDKNTLYFSGYFGRDKLGIQSTFGFNWGNATGTLRWNHIYNPRLFSNTSLILSNYDYAIESLIQSSEFTINSSIKDVNLKHDFSYSLGEYHQLKFGFDFNRHTITPGDLNAPQNSSINLIKQEKTRGLESAMYISDQFQVNPKLNLIYGLRLSAFSVLGGSTFKTYNASGEIISSNYYSAGTIVKTYFNIEPRISASFQLSSNNSLKASYNRNVQNLHLMSNSTASSPSDLYIMNSNNTKPELADQVALGYFQNFADNKFEFSMETYYKDMQNQIEYRNGTDLRANVNVEADLIYGKGRAYGIEFQVRKKEGRFNGWVSYTLAKTERQFKLINDGNWFNARQDKPHDLALVGIFNLNERWTFSSNFVLSSGNTVTYPIAKYQLNGKTVFLYGDRNANRMPTYHRLDISANLNGKPNKKYQSSWNFGIYNLYNRKNAYAINFRDNESNKTEAIQTSLFGIIPSITWNFKF
ncbi:MAG: TonB-dependent receptor [Pedobacter sp.]|nr:MAG: TonB-dependent receptor [Pedobacter sp.]